MDELGLTSMAKSDYRQKLSGIFPSITTPFIDDNVNYAGLASNIQKYNELDLGGYMILGGNGEYLGLTDREAHRIVETIMAEKKPGRTVVAGAGRESARATLDFIKSIAGYGVDVASVITPFYFGKHMRDQNLIDYYRKVADASPIPVLIYNSPDYAAGVEISPYAVSVLSRHGNIVGMKNSSHRELSDYTAQISEETVFYFHAGRAAVCLRDLMQGAVGATLSMAIYWPEQCIRLYRLFSEGRRREAEELGGQLAQASTISKYGVPGVKCAMELAGYVGGEPRLPLLPLTLEQREEIKGLCTKLGENHSYEDIDRMR